MNTGPRRNRSALRADVRQLRFVGCVERDRGALDVRGGGPVGGVRLLNPGETRVPLSELRTYPIGFLLELRARPAGTMIGPFAELLVEALELAPPGLEITAAGSPLFLD